MLETKADGLTTDNVEHLPVIPERLPIYPLVTTVLFPAGVAALQIADEQNLQLAASLEEEKDILGLFCLSGVGRKERQPGDLQRVGVAAKVVQKLRLGDRRLQILCHGIARIELDEIESTEPYLIGRVHLAEGEQPKDTAPAAKWQKGALDRYKRLTEVDQRYSEETVEVLRLNADSGPSFLADLLASLLNIPLDEKRKLVGLIDPVDRLQMLTEILDRELSRNAVEADIEEKVRNSLEEKRREHFLREQLRVIRDSLGESEGPKNEADQYAALIEGLPLDDDAKRTLERECERLAIMSEHATEYPVQSNYLDTVFGLPWWEGTDDTIDLGEAERLLSLRHHGVEEIKVRLLEFLSVIKLRGRVAGSILCLAGPPGTGKTSLAQSIAEAMGRKFARISLGGVSDESEIRGHRKTYIGAMPGKLIAAYDQAGSRNPVILLDEIDKLGKGLRGDPSAAMLEVLDPEQNSTFVDRYIGVPFDLSETLFIATANLLDDIPGPLRDRLEIIRIAGYTEAEKEVIAKKFMMPKLLEAHGLEAKSVRLSQAAIRKVIRGYTSEAGVRGLERKLARICRKAAFERAKDEQFESLLRVGQKQVESFLGPVLFEQEFAGRRPEVGVATGLAWTGGGGAILFIEATRMEGSGNIRVTGQLGDVMRESVETAFSYVRSHAQELAIPTELSRQSDIHIHFPAGAIPKDGPSAGTAAATCLASLLSGRPVRHDVAMTGEITLRGKILSVGGIKEKCLAAHRARIKKVLFPFGNRKDLVSVPEEVRKDLEIVFVDRVEDAWKEALVPLLTATEKDLKRYQ